MVSQNNNKFLQALAIHTSDTIVVVAIAYNFTEVEILFPLVTTGRNQNKPSRINVYLQLTFRKLIYVTHHYLVLHKTKQINHTDFKVIQLMYCSVFNIIYLRYTQTIPPLDCCLGKSIFKTLFSSCYVDITVKFIAILAGVPCSTVIYTSVRFIMISELHNFIIALVTAI